MDLVKRVLLLFAEDQARNADKLRTVLESESAGDVEVIDLADIAVANSPEQSFSQELQRCDRILLLCSPLATELIDKELSRAFEVDNGQRVCFDGKTISRSLKDSNGNLRDKVIPVSFAEIPAALLGASGKAGRAKGPICFGVKRKKPVSAKMLEGDVMSSLIAVIKGN